MDSWSIICRSSHLRLLHHTVGQVTKLEYLRRWTERRFFFGAFTVFRWFVPCFFLVGPLWKLISERNNQIILSSKMKNVLWFRHYNIFFVLVIVGATDSHWTNIHSTSMLATKTAVASWLQNGYNVVAARMAACVVRCLTWKNNCVTSTGRDQQLYGM